jgi:integrase
MSRQELWSKSFGERGCKVRVYEARAGSPLMRSVYIDGKEVRRSLGHRDRELAKRQAYEFIAQLSADEEAIADETATLGLLMRIYCESPAFTDKKERTRTEDRRRLERMVRFLGPARDAMSLSESDTRRFVSARRRGDPSLLGVVPGVGVRDRSIQADLVALHTMLNWGAKERDRRGRRLLAENPLRGIPIPREKNPRRPLMEHPIFEVLRVAAEEVNPLLATFLVLADASGRRLSACRQLRWSHIDFEPRSSGPQTRTKRVTRSPCPFHPTPWTLSARGTPRVGAPLMRGSSPALRIRGSR